MSRSDISENVPLPCVHHEVPSPSHTVSRRARPRVRRLREELTARRPSHPRARPARLIGELDKHRLSDLPEPALTELRQLWERETAQPSPA